MNGPLAQQSRSLQRCCLRQAQLTREAQRDAYRSTSGGCALRGASWQAIGAALGITPPVSLGAIPAPLGRHSEGGNGIAAAAASYPTFFNTAGGDWRDRGIRPAMRAAGASWQAIGAALGITRQSAWERFRHLSADTAKGATASRRPQPAPRYSPKQRRRERQALVVQRMRAAGASWQAIGAALGITRQSAWERFRHICAPDKNIPEVVLQARHLRPNAFETWVNEAAKTDMQVRQWLETPNIHLSAARGYSVAVPPNKLLGNPALRTF